MVDRKRIINLELDWSFCFWYLVWVPQRSCDTHMRVKLQQEEKLCPAFCADTFLAL